MGRWSEEVGEPTFARVKEPGATSAETGRSDQDKDFYKGRRQEKDVNYKGITRSGEALKAIVKGIARANAKALIICEGFKKRL